MYEVFVCMVRKTQWFYHLRHKKALIMPMAAWVLPCGNPQSTWVPLFDGEMRMLWVKHHSWGALSWLGTCTHRQKLFTTIECISAVYLPVFYSV